MTEVMTVLGPVAAADLGYVDAHEHLFLRTPALPGDEFWDEDKSTEEAAAVRASGISAIIDLTPVGLGRRPTALAKLSTDAGLHVVAATGYHRAAHYPAWHWAREVSEDVLLDVLLTDLTTGIDDRDWAGPRPVSSTIRAGVVKLGASYQRITADEHRWFRAGAEAARQVGVPVAVHCETGTAAHDILDLLAELGIAAHRVLLCHTDRNADLDLHLELASRGAHLVYDTVGRIKYGPDARILDLIEGMAAAGLAGQVCLGTDVGRRSMLRAYGGGPGMDVLGRTFLPRLERRLGRDLVDLVMRDAPASLFSSTPQAARATPG
ncbi:phosphotriesterase family protein [Kribbella italica]|uniref:Phosphotriesterase-related protein n=1 Tax=Kribbella italica TaxID=1540520 RepID=A0A7W9JED2_9ACTN|nr:aryldialkylphosphatase [Kribbella italica]MBB5840604.1 phosphotriesterase-related protein [Kribbella italica]